jgi:hypothetical protein
VTWSGGRNYRPKHGGFRAEKELAFRETVRLRGPSTPSVGGPFHFKQASDVACSTFADIRALLKPAYDFIINTMNDHSQVQVGRLSSAATDYDIAIGSVA